MNVLDLPNYTVEDESTMRKDKDAMQIWYKTSLGFGGKRQFHRLRGPALIFKKGVEAWYRDDKPYTPTAHERMAWELRKKNECS